MAFLFFSLTLFILQHRDYTNTGGLWSLFETLGKLSNYNPISPLHSEKPY